LERTYRSRLLLLREWRSVAYRIARMIKNLYPEAEVYLIGGVAEKRITVNSDIDVAIVFKKELVKNERIDILTRVWELMDNTIPLYYPIEIHILSTSEFMKVRSKKIKLV